jgi:hypothetical protein
MNKIIFSKITGQIFAYGYAQQDINALLSLRENTDYIEVQTLPDEQAMFTHQVNLETRQLEPI